MSPCTIPTRVCPKVGPAALPEHPKPLLVPVLQAPGLRRLGDALPDVLATDVPAPAGRERREGKRRVAVAAEAAAVEVGDGRESSRSGGHFRFASSRHIYKAIGKRKSSRSASSISWSALGEQGMRGICLPLKCLTPPATTSKLLPVRIPRTGPGSNQTK
jgi:hypothetical protein